MKRLDLYRLGRQASGGGTGPDDASEEGEARHRERSRTVAGNADLRLPLLEKLGEQTGGEILASGGGRILRIEEFIPRGELHGSVRLEDVYSNIVNEATILFPALDGHAAENFPLGDLLFFDTETTGLSGGAGTYLFLIGFLRIERDGFRLLQYFMHSLSSERCFLEEIARELRAGPFLVSYNGRSYDYNILRNRYVMAALPFMDDDPVHLDLLYTSRKIWRGLYPDYTLATVESRALGVGRNHDIPGWQIPDVYAHYLRGREVLGDMVRVIRHNRNDVLSLLALLVRQLGLLADAAGSRQSLEEYNPFTLSDMLVTGRRGEQAMTLLSANRSSNEALKRLALLNKREHNYVQALKHFDELHLRRAGIVEYVFACTEAAKICEHRLGDYEAALRYTERMLSRLQRAKYFGSGTRSTDHLQTEILRRLRRLKGKLGRAAGSAGGP
jgi:uncharacterized protein YprB with RNaseH-like and TPR domain